MIALLALGAVKAVAEKKLSAEDACAKLFRPTNWTLLQQHGYSELAELFEKFSEFEDIENIVPNAFPAALETAEKDLLYFLEKSATANTQNGLDPNFLWTTEGLG